MNFVWSRSFALLLWAFFALLAVGIYWDALSGPFISDDLMYIAANPWTEQLSSERILGILNPFGDARFQTVNYAPLHLIVTALERQIFWDDPFGYHLVNVLIHATAAVLFGSLLVASGLSARLALLGAAIFLLHPANVEAVAWISQLKTNGSLALSLGALLCFRRHPAWATLLFAAALCTKASAAFALPMAAVTVWSRSENLDTRSQWRWIAVWAAVFALYSIPQYTAFNPRGMVTVEAYEDVGVQLRSMASIGTRYLVMAGTTWGLSHTPEHAPVRSLLDPWWLASLPIAALLLWRIAVVLRRRSEEAAYWIAAAAAFGPISQLWPFSHPMADRYLYFILPGLIGGTLFALRDAGAALRISGPAAVRVAVVLSLALAVFLGARAEQRARLWSDEMLLTLDSARHFPSGRSALYLAALQDLQAGDAPTAIARLREMAELGRDHFHPFLQNPMFAPLQAEPAFRELIHDLAGRYIELIESRERPTPSELAATSVAHFERGEYEAAERALERAVRRGGLTERRFAAELEGLRSLRSQLEANGSSKPDGQ